MPLRWEDIILDERLIYIQRGVTFTSNQPIVGTPKTKAGYRVIPITDHLLPHLQSARKSGYVVGGGETPITQSTYDRAMERIGKTINMHGATAHVFRHSYLTFLGTLNTNVKTIQAIAGHSDIQITMNRYVHQDTEQIRLAGCEFSKKVQNFMNDTTSAKSISHNTLEA